MLTKHVALTISKFFVCARPSTDVSSGGVFKFHEACLLRINGCICTSERNAKRKSYMSLMLHNAAQPNSTPHRIVICLTMSPPLPVTPPSRDDADGVPGFFSKIFQNFKLSSAAIAEIS